MYHPFTPLLLAELAPELGITLELEPSYRFAGELIHPNGKRQVFHNANLNLNGAASTHIANDKGYTCHFLRKHGFRVPDNQSFFSDRVNQKLPPAKRRDLDHAQTYASELGYPVFIKPNNLSQGAFVTKVWQALHVREIGEAIFARNDVLLVERACSGRDYRVVVLGDVVHAAYERIPLTVTGDGVSSIHALLLQYQHSLQAAARLNSDIGLDDMRIDLKLQQHGYTRESVPAAGEKLVLLDNANLSTGGTSSDVSDAVHPSFARIAVAASQAIGLTLCGVDIICADLTQDAALQDWHIIELNAAPGMENYAAMGIAQRERVKALYRAVLQRLMAA